MFMKKRFLSFLLSVFMIVSCSLGLTGCEAWENFERYTTLAFLGVERTSDGFYLQYVDEYGGYYILLSVDEATDVLKVPETYKKYPITQVGVIGKGFAYWMVKNNIDVNYDEKEIEFMRAVEIEIPKQVYCHRLIEEIGLSMVEDIDIIIKGGGLLKLVSLMRCSNVDIFYEGSEQEMSGVTIEKLTYDENGAHKLDPNATVNVYYYSETQPQTQGNYWHYVDGEPVIW